MNFIKQNIQKPIISYLLFWILFFVFTSSISSWYYSSTKEVLETYSFRILIQCFIASIVVFLLVPKFLNKNKKVLLISFSFLLLLIGYISCTLIKIYYLEPTYPITYQRSLAKYSDPSFLGRLTNIKDFLYVSNYLVQPTFILLAIQFYRKQQILIKLNEQKKVAELQALKNQLNPHFLFNTLNSLYALAFKKSDKTLLVIQKLSDILDYTLYRCNDKYVSLEKEVELIENYIDLEKIRYTEKVEVSFKKEIKTPSVIAPLLLLTFVENAFKHSVSGELDQASIKINLISSSKEIYFKIKNSKSKKTNLNTKKDVIGLENLKKQLNLLYSNKYRLEIKDQINQYTVELKLLIQ